MKRYNKNLGDFGEAAAADYLCTDGYKILARNYRSKHGEIDIIALKDNVLSFIEVKTRSSDRYGIPSEAVDRKKRQHMLFVAEGYLSEKTYFGDISFDVIEVYAVINGSHPNLIGINHIKNIVMDT